MDADLARKLAHSVGQYMQAREAHTRGAIMPGQDASLLSATVLRERMDLMDTLADEVCNAA